MILFMCFVGMMLIFLDVGKNILFLLSRRAWSSLEMGLMDIIDDI